MKYYCVAETKTAMFEKSDIVLHFFKSFSVWLNRNNWDSSICFYI